MTVVVAGEDARKSFYPTPPGLADTLLEGIDFYKIKTILEPEAGRGDLIRAIGRKLITLRSECGPDIDMIEIDPALRGILQQDFCNGVDYYNLVRECRAAMDDKERKIPPTAAEKAVYDELYAMYRISKGEVHIVFDDFLQYDGQKKYDLILMNPPFQDGELHLLKAISMQERYGGMIRCVLNAETIRNPYSKRRIALLDKLNALNAEISFRDGAFSNAERQTDVSVAIIKLDIPAPVLTSRFFEHFQKAEEAKLQEEQPTEVAHTDIIKAITAQYRVEVNAGISLIREYEALKPYILDSIQENRYSKPNIELKVNARGSTLAELVNSYIKGVRMKYWTALFKREDIIGQFTSNLQNEYAERVKEMAAYDFDEYNIHRLLEEMNSKMVSAVKETIVALFETLTVDHHWSNEFTKNTHYFNGWATNKAHFVNEKVILPCYGVFPSYKYSWETDAFKVYEAHKALADIEKVLNYLDGNMTADVDLYATLQRASTAGVTRNIPCKYFDVTFYKKGTMHIKFTNKALLDRFNIYCCREKNWLPPTYGRKHYKDMDEQEKAVVDSFHGDDTPGSGELAYSAVVAKANYYLAPANQLQLALPGSVV